MHPVSKQLQFTWQTIFMSCGTQAQVQGSCSPGPDTGQFTVYDTATNPISNKRHYWRQSSLCDKRHQRQTSFRFVAYDNCRSAIYIYNLMLNNYTNMTSIRQTILETDIILLAHELNKRRSYLLVTSSSMYITAMIMCILGILTVQLGRQKGKEKVSFYKYNTGYWILWIGQTKSI